MVVDNVFTMREEIKNLKRELIDKTAAINRLKTVDSIQENALLGKAFAELDRQHQQALSEIDSLKSELAASQARGIFLDKQLRTQRVEAVGEVAAQKDVARQIVDNQWKERELQVSKGEQEALESIRNAQRKAQEWRHRCIKEVERVEVISQALQVAREENDNHMKYIAKLEEARMGKHNENIPMRDRVLDMHRQLSEATERLFADAQRVAALEDMRLADVRRIVQLEDQLGSKTDEY